VILADGRIIDVRIVESSGKLRLDEDARALVSSVSPLKLARVLEADRLTVKIPIVFGLR
jgi:TonB family protein